ncbi:MAG: Coenzyme F420 hydrogenase/dehydrogenase, beta subunit C-terminal domain [Pseudomonadota bacterium]|nr:Coenzyme F420 hydrogenase/dehydrogenase, beta subunit C-terminal domain [Pseudomonadota bacterium]
MLSVEQIVTGGLCIGCGLCRSIAGGERIKIVMTPEGRERPVVALPLDEATLRRINAVCPGTRIDGATSAPHPLDDLIWGPAELLAVGHAGDPHVRHRGSSGGVLTALGQFILQSGRAEFIVHVGAAGGAPMRTERRVSYDAQAVLEGAGSRYGPAAPLIDFLEVLEQERPFALIAKPCDVDAVRNLAKIDRRVDRYMRYALAMVCGGASDLGKSTGVLDEYGIREDEVAMFRYRGCGNPGPTRIETKDGRVVELSYQEMWAAESTWRIQARCKVCPNAIGESSDLTASDVWPGGAPAGDDAGYNGIIVRTARGLELYRAALAAGVIIAVPQEVGFRDFDEYQPHQVRKKRAVWARLAGLRAAGYPVPDIHGLRLKACARLNSLAENLAEARGSRVRADAGAWGEAQAAAMAQS